MSEAGSEFDIALLADLHCGSPDFDQALIEHAIELLNSRDPRVVVIAGDLTHNSLPDEFDSAREWIDRIDCRNLVVVPGNHDVIAGGLELFESRFGVYRRKYIDSRVSVVAVDSAVPDETYGEVGVESLRNALAEFSDSRGIRVFALHHHLLPVPGTGTGTTAR